MNPDRRVGFSGLPGACFTYNPSQMSRPSTSLSRHYLGGAMLCLWLAALCVWLGPETETGWARLMLRAFLYAAAGMAIYGLLYAWSGARPLAVQGFLWYWLALISLGSILLHLALIGWTGWNWLYCPCDATAVYWEQVVGALPVGLRVSWAIWGLAQVGAGLHWLAMGGRSGVKLLRCKSKQST